MVHRDREDQDLPSFLVETNEVVLGGLDAGQSVGANIGYGLGSGVAGALVTMILGVLFVVPVLLGGAIVYLAGARAAGRTFLQAALDWQVVVVAEAVLILVGLMSAFT
jgi:hypothetical protein